MSAVIQTTTPFTIQEVLMEALRELGAEPLVITRDNQAAYAHAGGLKINDIVTNRSDYYGPQNFRQENGRWLLRHDSSEMDGRVIADMGSKHYQPVIQFLAALSEGYDRAYLRHLERLAEKERQRLEEERKARVEATRLKAIERARAQGYSVKETHANGKIQLVLTRSV